MKRLREWLAGFISDATVPFYEAPRVALGLPPVRSPYLPVSFEDGYPLGEHPELPEGWNR